MLTYEQNLTSLCHIFITFVNLINPFLINKFAEKSVTPKRSFEIF